MQFAPLTPPPKKGTDRVNIPVSIQLILGGGCKIRKYLKGIKNQGNVRVKKIY